jgi:hypothetical protein
MYGPTTLPEQMRQHRADYYHDMQFLLDTLSRLGIELKGFPLRQRSMHLRNALSQCNKLLYYRMLSKQSFAGLHTYNYHPHPTETAGYPGYHTGREMSGYVYSGQGQEDIYGSSSHQHKHHISPPLASQSIHDLHIEDIARQCPDIASYSLHLPLLHSNNHIYRILRFLEEECEILQSKDKVPYLIVVELLEESALCKSTQLYTAHHDLSAGKGHKRLLDKRLDKLAGNIADDQMIDSGILPLDDSASNQLANVKLFARDDVAMERSRDPLAMRGGQSYQPHPQDHAHAFHSSDDRQQPGHAGDGYYYDRNMSPPPPTHLAHDCYPSYSLAGYPHPNQHHRPHRPHHPSHHHPESHTPGYVKIKTWSEKKQLIQSLSSFGHLSGYTIKSFIVKSGDDMTKEMLALQLIQYITQIFQQEKLDIYLQPYQILPTGHQYGLIEYLEGSLSVDKIKKISANKCFSIKDYFALLFGASYGLAYGKALQNFVSSLVGYSLFTYLVQVKDRHNANILIDGEGHLIHIDFGFILGGEQSTW